MSKGLEVDRILQSQGFDTRAWRSELIAAGGGRCADSGRLRLLHNRFVADAGWRNEIRYGLAGDEWCHMEAIQLAPPGYLDSFLHYTFCTVSSGPLHKFTDASGLAWDH